MAVALINSLLRISYQCSY